MQAIILAGGKGTRLRPYTTILPKPLMPVGEYPILEILLRRLKQSGIDRVFMAVGYLGHLIEAYMGDGRKLGLEISYSFESKELGTAGPISLVLDQLDDDFFVINGDLLTTLRFDKLHAFHRSKTAAATIATYQRTTHIDFGVISISNDQRLLNYHEKPKYHFDVSMGINVLNKAAIIPYLRHSDRLDIPELMTKLKDDGRPVYCYQEACLWLDIGRQDDYASALDLFETHRDDFLAGNS
jgi:NDP-sugar pyrophosphorylase family protein